MLAVLLTSIAAAVTPVYAAPAEVGVAIPSPLEAALPDGCTIDVSLSPPSATASSACGSQAGVLHEAVLGAVESGAATWTVPRSGSTPLLVRFGACPDGVVDSLCPVHALQIDQRRHPVAWPARARRAGHDRCVVEVIADDSGIREIPPLRLHRLGDCPRALQRAARKAIRGWVVLGGVDPVERIQRVVLIGVAEVHLSGEPRDLLVPDRTGPARVRGRRPVSPRGTAPDQACEVRVTIDEYGVTTAVEPLPRTCPEALRQPTVDALSEWQWGPVVVDGRPVPSTFRTRIRFP